MVLAALVVGGCASGDDYSLQSALNKSYADVDATVAARQAYISSSRESARLSVEQYKQDPSTNNLMNAGDALGDYQSAKFR
ncbi:hypothetical protein [Robbsia andropogonis]|uniref:hypothetical protein n=1 Tax=Robbsia andropogonis TaxID=28092 RepID=UPI002A6A13A5|nr:hypothetical protein [Robbsia andropogonis]